MRHGPFNPSLLSSGLLTRPHFPLFHHCFFSPLRPAKWRLASRSLLTNNFQNLIGAWHEKTVTASESKFWWGWGGMGNDGILLYLCTTSRSTQRLVCNQVSKANEVQKDFVHEAVKDNFVPTSEKLHSRGTRHLDVLLRASRRQQRGPYSAKALEGSTPDLCSPWSDCSLAFSCGLLRRQGPRGTTNSPEILTP